MADLTLGELRDFVRLHLDVDEDDLPTLLLDAFIREAYDDWAEAEYEWSFFEFEESWTTTSGQQSYELATMFGGTPPLKVRSINDVREATFQLRPRDHRQMRELFHVDNASGRPTRYSKWNDKLYLWPTPDDAIDLTMTGHREPYDWVADGVGGVPDAPEPFHQPIAMAVLSLAYAHIDDPEYAILYGQRAETRFKRLRQSYVRGLDAQPLVLNRPRGTDFQRRGRNAPFIFDWE